jgi:translation initiation factor IF-2
LAVRIYSLAKELNIDSKLLVDMCTKAGVTGKGSALASLTEEEVAVVRAFVAGGGRSSPAKPASSAAPRTVTGGTTATLAPPSPVRREDYIPPTGSTGKPPVLGVRLPDKDRSTAEVAKKPGDGQRPPQRPTGPAIKLAPMPSVAQPPPAAAPAEPAAQKPDIKLPADAIRASRSGAKPLSEHLRKHEEKRKAEAASVKKGDAAPRKAPLQPPVPAGTFGRDRGRRGGRAGEGEGDTSLLGGREQRQLARKKASKGRRSGDDDDSMSRSGRRLKRTGTSIATAPRKSKASLVVPCNVREFLAAAGLPSTRVLLKLMQLNVPAPNINTRLEPEVAELLAVELGLELELKRPADPEEQLLAQAQEPDDAAALQPRPPVVTFLGHVDHGKTSLLDRIIGIDVASGESGGITQHIRAYGVQRGGKLISFVDTPGHEAFTQMRARGAQVTDIAVLVVAADDGVMPQTEEAISHGRAAGVPIVVALNKIDLPAANAQRAYEQLAANELLPVEWGGETEVVKTSAVTGEGIDKLLETLLLTAELHDYRANPDRPAHGTCLEAQLHEGRGVVAKLLVQQGTLRIGDVVVCGAAYGRVKTLYDTLQPRETHAAAGPSTPVDMTGLDTAPAAGDRFYVVDDIALARQIAERRAAQGRNVALTGAPAHVTLETLYQRLGQEDVQSLNLILRADVRGSIEAIRKELSKLQHPEVQIKILQATVGGVSEADVHLADASDAIIIGFNVVADEGARALAERLGVQVRRYDIIYQVTDDLKAALEGMLKPEQREVDLGRALVKRAFSISRVGTVAGCQVLVGTVERNARLRVIRDSRVIGDYAIESLKREKDDAREVRQGFECGIKLAGFNDVKEGDILEAYRVEEVARTIGPPNG